MPYSKIEELPMIIRNNLPEGAQKIFKETFNSAWEHYSEQKKEKVMLPGKKLRIRSHGLQ